MRPTPHERPVLAARVLAALLGSLACGSAVAQVPAAQPEAASGVPAGPAPPLTQAPPALTHCLRSPPTYPEEARRKGMEGRNLVLFTVSADGVPGLPEIGRSSGHPRLDAAARRHVHRCLEPFRQATTPGLQPGRYGVPMDFRLE